jgi:F0F1-type ATP synthase delta subunit
LLTKANVKIAVGRARQQAEALSNVTTTAAVLDRWWAIANAFTRAIQKRPDLSQNLNGNDQV